MQHGSSGTQTPTAAASALPLVLVVGMPRSGKTSVVRVVFSKMSPHDTIMLHSDSDVLRTTVHSLATFRIWDLPGVAAVADDLLAAPVLRSIVFVIDAQDDYVDALLRLQDLLRRGARLNPRIAYEVFVHKVDGLSEDFRDDIQRDIRQRIQDFIEDYALDADLDSPPRINFHMTSIYELSVFEACSKVVQKLVPQQDMLENLMTALTGNSGIDKAFLFDVQHKVYLSSDSNPFHGSAYEMGVDLIDLFLDICFLYDDIGSGGKNGTTAAPTTGQTPVTAVPDTRAVVKLNNGLTMYFKELNSFLGLVCLIRTEHFDKHGLLDYNVNLFRDAIQAILESQQNQAQQRSEVHGMGGGNAMVNGSGGGAG